MAGNRSPYVPMRTDLVKDERVAFIADLCACSRDEVLGRLFRLWAWCTDRKLADAPPDCPGYAVHPAVVRRFLGPLGERAILGDGCADLALGDVRQDGLIFLHGTDGAVTSLRSLYARSQAGGEERVKTATRDRGRFVAAPTNTPAETPAVATVLPDPDPDPDQREIKAPPPPPPPGPTRTQGRRGAAAAAPAETQPAAEPAEPTLEQLWTELEQARQRAAAARGVSIRPLVAHDSGRKDLAEALVEAARVDKRAELVADVRHAIAAAEAESRVVPEPGKRDQLQWFTGAIFSPRNFRRLAGTPVKAARARPATSPSPAAEYRRPTEPQLTDDDRAELAELSKRLGSVGPGAAIEYERARGRAPTVASKSTADLVTMFGPGERAPPVSAPHDDHDDEHNDHGKESA
jgi:hypothetical protein